MADAAVRSRKPATSRRTPAGGAPTAAHSAAEASEPRIDVNAVTELLLGTWADTRREARVMIKDPAFWRVDGMPMDEHRERVLTQLHLLVEAGGSRRAFPKQYGGHDNNGANLAGFMELVLADPSLQIKSGVQWGLFGSAVYQLGTQKHWDEWLEAQREKIRRALALLERDAIAELTCHFDVASISVACALGYLDLRFPDLGWRDANPQLANWFFEVSQRPSMIATMPKA